MKNLTDAADFLKNRALELKSLEDMDKYKYLTELGDSLTPFPNELVVEENKVPGCTSGVYLFAYLEDNTVFFMGKSQSIVVRGYLSTLIEALSGLSPSDIIDNTHDIVREFMEEVDLSSHLSPNRANAFGNIYKMMIDKVKKLRK